MEHGKVITIHVRDVVEGERARKIYNGLDRLAASIKENGLIQPILVIKAGDKYQLVCGGRRFRASMIAGIVEIPAILRESLTERERLVFELEENLNREGHTWDEEIALKRKIDLMKKQLHGERAAGEANPDAWSVRDTADLLGEDRSNVSNQIWLAGILEERPELRDKLVNLPLTTAIRVARQLLAAEVAARKYEGAVPQSSDFQFIQGHCLDVLKAMDAASVDMVLTDPPYGIDELLDVPGIESESYKGTLDETDNLDMERMKNLFPVLLYQLNRVMKPSAHGYIFFSFDLYASLIEALKACKLGFYVTPLIWKKGGGFNLFRGYNYMSAYEPIMYFWKEPRNKRLNKPSPNILEVSALSPRLRKHPFEKPTALLEIMITQSSNLGDTILDPFMGSGSCARAAFSTGRRFVGIDINPRYVAVAKEALDATRGTFEKGGKE